MTRRSWLLVIAIAGALVIATLLRQGKEAPSIVLWHSYRGDSELVLKSIAKRYEQNHGIRVELLALPFDAYAAKLTAAVPHAHGPDLFIDAHERLGSYRKDSIVAPVGDAFPPEDLGRYDLTATRAITADDGTRYAVPLESKCLALYVNEALLPRPPATFEELAEYKQSLGGGVYPIAYEAPNPYFHAPLLHGFGGAMLNVDGSFALSGDAAAASINLVRKLTDEKAIPEEPSGSLVLTLFASGRAATVISGPWFAAELKDKVRFRIEPLPNVRATGRPMQPFLTVDGVFLTPTGAKRSDVRAFARHLGSHDIALERAKVGHQVVATTSVWSDETIARDRLLEPFHRAAERAVPMPSTTTMRATWVPAEQAIRKILRGDMEANAALAEAKARFEDVLKPPPPPPRPTPLLVAFGLALLAGAIAFVRKTREPMFAIRFRASKPAYGYVAHAAVIVLVLVIFPLVAGTAASFFAGTRDHPSYVGLGNYIAILTARGGALLGHGSFYLTLLVTVLWTIANVMFHVAIGMALGLLLSRAVLRLKAIYRVLLILPWAVPSYVTALAWKGMFHRQFGAINAILEFVGAPPVSWFSKFSTAFAANLATNVWLGFPFMMVVTLGALTSIPKDVLEAADVDGATRVQRFRYVTFPLLKPALLPAVVLGSVWTFNMFNVVFLVSGGEPDGTTDILVSEAYRWAFTRDAQYGYAAAYAVIIFFLLLFGSRLLGRLAANRGEEQTT